MLNYSATLQENSASNEETGGGTITLTINPVVDGLTIDSNGVVASSDEYYIADDGTVTNKFIQISGIGSSGDSDGSESVTSIILDKVPDGFLVYYGASGSETLALNAGVNSSAGTYSLNGEDVNYNTWAITPDNGTMPNIYLVAPQNFSGEVTDISLEIKIDDGGASATQTQTFDLYINPLANDITANATKTFGSEGEDIPINFNANIQDLDGSESVTVTLKGFGDDNATFKVDGTAIDSDNVSYDSDNDTYTLTNIPAKDINDLSFVHSAKTGSIDFTLVTNDKATINGSEISVTNSSTVSGSFDINITESIPSSDGDTLLYKGESIDALDGDDTLVLGSSSIDFSKVDNIETLDLGAGDHDITLTLKDVVDMTDDRNDLVIKGDSADNVSFSDSGWSSSDDGTWTTWTNSNDSSVSVKIEDHIQHTV